MEMRISRDALDHILAAVNAQDLVTAVRDLPKVRTTSHIARTPANDSVNFAIAAGRLYDPSANAYELIKQGKLYGVMLTLPAARTDGDHERALPVRRDFPNQSRYIRV
jgi:hypothetical protein